MAPLTIQGTYTALVTPFNRDGSVDFGRLRALIAAQVEAGVDGIAPVGTTGESATLNYEEHNKVVAVSVEAARGRIQVIAGTGSNATSEALELTRHAKEAGADATLQVTPYYNRPSQEGLYRHFSAVADLGLPVVLYNIPGRTGREITVDTVERLARHPNVIAVKEAGGSVKRVGEILARCSLTVLSGDDALTVPMMAEGAKGVVSVASNVVPEGIVRMVRCALQGKRDEAQRMHQEYEHLFTALFLDTNPVPVKAALAMMGRIEEVYRLPLCPMADPLKNQLRDCLRNLKLL